MPKSRFFRVAVEGATTDGRVIERRWLAEAAKNYNPATYAARVNLEHVRGLSPMAADNPANFGSYGDVLALKAEEITLELAGKSEKRLALFAQIEALEPLVKMNTGRQKLFSSIEISPDFADTGEAYLVGLAVTDSPASLGTEMLAFSAGLGEKSPLANRKQHPANLFTAAEEFELELEDPAGANPADPTGVFASLRALIDRFTPTAAPAVIEPPAVPAADPAIPSSADFVAALAQIAGAIEASSSALSSRLAVLEDAAATAAATQAATPAEAFANIAPATGGEAELRTDC